MSNTPELIASEVGEPRWPWRRTLVAMVSVLAAVALNVLLMRGILYLNRAAADRAPAEKIRSTVRVLTTPPPNRPTPPPTTAIEETPQPIPTVEVDLPLPPPAPLDLPPLQFDLQLPLAAPSVATVEVATRVAVGPTRNPRPSPEASGNSGPLDSGSVDQPPRELASSPKPVYPRVAQRRRIEGLVAIELLIDESGRVRESRNARGDPLLIKAVLDVLPRLRFAPARHEGATVPVWGRKTFRFQLPQER